MIDDRPGWHIDPDTLVPVLDGEAGLQLAHADDPAVEVLVALWSGQPDRAAELLEPLVSDDPTWRLRRASFWIPPWSGSPRPSRTPAPGAGASRSCTTRSTATSSTSTLTCR